MQYIGSCENAYGISEPTFLGESPNAHNKHPVLQVFSFKLRGAYNMMAKLSRDQLKKGVICSSAGNHAQGVALAARKLGCDAIIAMPVTTPEIKVSAMPSDFFLLLSCKGFKLVKSYS